jgi:hypothetical protein
MLPHQQRVIDEYDALITKTEALSKFTSGNELFTTLAETEQSLLLGQLGSMLAYGVFLKLRIDLF